MSYHVIINDTKLAVQVKWPPVDVKSGVNVNLCFNTKYNLITEKFEGVSISVRLRMKSELQFWRKEEY